MQDRGISSANSAGQFARFIDAAERLSESLNNNFDEFFDKVVANARLKRHAEIDGKNGSSRNVTPIEQAIKRKHTLPEKSLRPSQSPALGMDSSLIVRLHFVEAMMVLMFNAMNEGQQSSIKQEFSRFLKKGEDLEIPGVPAETLQLYRDALRAMQNMLASNPSSEEMATALTDDFAKRTDASRR